MNYTSWMKQNYKLYLFDELYVILRLLTFHGWTSILLGWLQIHNRSQKWI
jgi:hypothetical protein